MWPTLSDGFIARFEKIIVEDIKVGQIILTKHPLQSNLMIIKRVESISEGCAFLVGDNPDPSASDDSHNFGQVNISEIIAVMLP
jgi:hypothetical protein|tara:strand:- start:897 stop:1148 length:252 start_codon:yes stop_codon:yes gene_type:complete